MIVYTIFKNGELIWARNYSTNNIKDAKNRLKSTYEDIKNNNKITDINFEGKKLEFNDLDEKHIMLITE
ncbi:MAG: hypothetical protein ACI31S_01365 [Bacilli bacterium]